MDAVGDDERLVDHAAAVADLLDLGVQEQVGVAAFKRPGPEASTCSSNAWQTRLTSEREMRNPRLSTSWSIRASRRHRHRPVGPPRRAPALNAGAVPKAREVAALPDLGDLQLKLAGARVPATSPIAIAMRRPILRPTLATLCADQLGHLELHHLRRDGPDRLADHIGVLIEQHLPDDLLDRHPVGTGHRWRLLSSSNLEKSADDERQGGRNHLNGSPSDPRLHQP
jgi:hypothetical protein